MSEIANALANAYIGDEFNAKFEATRPRRSGFNNDCVRWEKRRKARNAQSTLISRRTTLKRLPKVRPIDEQQIAELNTRLDAARAQTTEATVRLNWYESALKHDPETLDSIGKMDATGSDLLASPIIPRFANIS